MKDTYAYIVQTRRVYGFFSDVYKKLAYVGSSYLPIEKLEYNHRNALTLWPEEDHSRFRKSLSVLDPEYGTFKTLVELECTRPVIEDLEGQLIRALKPFYNDDKDPVASSKYYERY